MIFKGLALFVTVNAFQAPVGPSWRKNQPNTRHKKKRMADAMERYKMQHNRFKRETKENRTVILQWWNFERPFLEKMPHECGGCWTSNDRNRQFSADAIMFDNTRYKNAKNLGDLPDYANRNINSQYWIFWPREAASKGIEKGTSYKLVQEWDSAFNLTASYRRDSDILRPFGDRNNALRKHYVNGHPQDWAILVDSIMSLKQNPGGKHTAWIVSNCGRTNGARARWAYAQSMIEHGLKLDGFGDCFGKHLNGAPWSDKFGDGLIAKYKFYLAFENSLHCNDYMSEKFWRNSLNTGAVPVIYGPHPDDVKAVAPPKSYIHAEDFSSAEELVAYLDYLDSNDTAYLEYHAWRSEELPKDQITELGGSMSHTMRMLCNMCDVVTTRKQQGFPRRIIKSVASWWWVNVHDDLCTKDYAMPEWVRDFPPVTMENSFDELKLKFLPEDFQPK